MSTSPGRHDGWRIIATDDNTSKLSAIVNTLREAGHCVFAAYDGASALELVVQLPNVDLLITNTRLGVVDGPELMRRTREMRPDMPMVPEPGNRGYAPRRYSAAQAYCTSPDARRSSSSAVSTVAHVVPLARLALLTSPVPTPNSCLPSSAHR